MRPWLLMLCRVAQITVGLAVLGTGIGLLLQAGLGLSPWEVFAQGIAGRIGLSFGTTVVIISVVVLLLWIPMRERPGLGTIANGLLVGPFAELSTWVLPQVSEWWERGLACAIGVLLTGVGTACYIAAGFGSGPRDGLMTGLHRITGKPVWALRTAIEVTVLGAGWLLGGTVGIGTVFCAFTVGPVIGFFLPRFVLPGAPVRVRPARQTDAAAAATRTGSAPPSSDASA
ncbi:YczE/YyaS/YitT family protein [Ruicaihuangia caeni]|uniref:membrane protein YczE n=1 Tax=Ruicaihuangia caeni TaxID=3042517 RepID=UPI00338D92D2